MNDRTLSDSHDTPDREPMPATGFFKGLMGWRGIRAAVLLILVLATLVAGFYVVENWRGRWLLKRYRTAAERNGANFDCKTFIPPPAADHENFAATPLWKPFFDYEPGNPVRWRDSNAWQRLQRVGPYYRGGSDSVVLSDFATGQRTKLDTWQSYYRKEATSATQGNDAAEDAFPLPPRKQSPADDVLFALKKFDAEMREIQAAAQRSRSRWPIHYEEGVFIPLPYLAKIRSFSGLFQLRAAAHLALTNAEAASADLHTVFQLTDTVREESFAISELVRLALIKSALSTLWEGICEHRWSDADLAWVQKRLENIDIEREVIRALTAEKAITAMATTQEVRDREQFLTVMKEYPGYKLPPALPTYIRYAPSGWFYRNELAWELWLDDLISAAERSRATGVYVEGPRGPATKSRFCSVPCFPLDFMQSLNRRGPLTHISVDLARLACALERFRLSHAEYPAALGDLVPKLISALPNDFINGQPLHYRRIARDSFLLYSVGLNKTDDGGTYPVQVDSIRSNEDPGGDCVWRVP